MEINQAKQIGVSRSKILDLVKYYKNYTFMYSNNIVQVIIRTCEIHESEV